MSDIKIGDVFSKLTVIEILKSIRPKNASLLCLCVCGNIRKINRQKLIDGTRVSCGCSKSADITGQTFNNLTAIEKCGKRGRRWLWRCLCKCVITQQQ
jgi:hypothetical protein